MQKPIQFLGSFSNQPIHVIDMAIGLENYTRIDLSTKNQDLFAINISNPKECQAYIDVVLGEKNATVAFGGYLEKRRLYEDNPSFCVDGKPSRNIHLGIDFWSSVGTQVLAPIDGKVHSFRNNSAKGDYGPTIILEHNLRDFRFHTLYGHLSLASLENLHIGKAFKKGDRLATLGSSDINVGYAPHLHFQIILDMEGKQGEYPGVCSAQDLEFYAQNCPDPNLLLGM